MHSSLLSTKALLIVQMLSLFFFAALSLASGPTSIFINQVPEYDLLSSCAEYQVSTIVRDMSVGCGDDSKTTSYACFCEKSFVAYSSHINASVVSACSTQYPDQNASAVEVFSKYCELGGIQASPTESTTTSSATATPASGVTTVFLTPSASSSAHPNDNNNHRTVAIAVGVAVPVGVIALGLLGFLLWHRRRKTTEDSAELSGEEHRVNEAGAEPAVYELKRECRMPPVEIGDGADRAELATPTKGAYAHAPVHELEGMNREKG